ncbi:hypothetical protein Nos7524_2212 [Nostoc sp. PCC 7524]|uniref:hypothetical protein n=1 Tax=Nostoc sp. (strain ATCC 29411 / PCC 7524) TaxID=28072 RepID=UPI00029F3D0A|nr:hypothetical protein [Nostoc sp. PCC 7524]AFY48057.1 hypothetical protein Nos7524_2212 [Nostoc sp. PCC 7524]
MSLPLILDVTIGLVFIYLILSLLASEIQELITTVLQWRAVHLKKSIEILIAGDSSKSEEDSVIELVNDLYNHPLLKSVNQEAKGFLTNLPRKFIWFISTLPVKLSLSGKKRTNSIFGYAKNEKGEINGEKHSAPSYIPAETFATTLLETLGIPKLVQKLTESRLINFANQLSNEMQSILLKLRELAEETDIHIFLENNYQDFRQIVESEFKIIISDYQKDKTDLITSMNRMARSLDRYINCFELDMPEHQLTQKSLQRLKLLRKHTFDDIEQTICLQGLRPNINEVVQLINVGSAVQQEFLQEFQDKDSEAYQTFQYVCQRLEQFSKQLPPSVVNNMAALAQRAQLQAQTTEEGINILRKEIEKTFENSMERASGVYKRNAKGVGLLIGISIAVIANADTFHIVSILSKDATIRTAIVNNAVPIVQANSVNSPEELKILREQTNTILEEQTLPLGWNKLNLAQQLGQTQDNQNPVLFNHYLTMVFGWLISGVAISMGAPFWFELIGRVINVRNSGKRPKSSVKHEAGDE